MAKWFKQRKGTDYNEFFSPVAKCAFIRILLAFSAHFNWKLDQLDVKTTFLNRDIDETIYKNKPKGFELNTKPESLSIEKVTLCFKTSIQTMV